MRLLKFCVVGAALSVLFASCGSTKVTRVDANTVVDVNEFWNDSDIRIVCDDLVNQCMTVMKGRVDRFRQENGRLPVVLVGRIRNDSDEHLDTSIVARRMENAIINSGVMDFVAGGSDREAIRDERAQQEDYARQTAKSMTNETAADYLLHGSIKTDVHYDATGKNGVRTYYVYAQLQEVESTKVVWSGENSEIKKVIKKAGRKL